MFCCQEIKSFYGATAILAFLRAHTHFQKASPLFSSLEKGKIAKMFVARPATITFSGQNLRSFARRIRAHLTIWTMLPQLHCVTSKVNYSQKAFVNNSGSESKSNDNKKHIVSYSCYLDDFSKEKKRCSGESIVIPWESYLISTRKLYFLEKKREHMKIGLLV